MQIVHIDNVSLRMVTMGRLYLLRMSATLLRCVTSNVGLTGFGYSSSSGTEDEQEDGDKEDEDELSESEEDAERVWEMIRRKRSAFDRRMQAVDDAHRGKSMSYWLLLCLSC